MSAPLGWAVLGTGGIVRRWLPGFRATGHRLVAVGSRDRARAAEAASEFGAARGGSYDEVLDDPEVEAVYIALPNTLHAEWTIRAAERGKHVLCEKPLAPTVDECTRMIEACSHHGVHLAEAFMYRYHPRWQAVWRAIEADRIGAVRLLRATFGFRMGPDRDGDIRLQPALGGGAIQDVGCYCVDVSRWFLGEPSRVTGSALDRRGIGVDTHAAAVFEHTGGALAELSCSVDAHLGQSVEIVGERGRIEVPRAFLPGTEPAPLVVVDGRGESRESIPVVDQYGLEVDAFVALIRGGAPILTPGSGAIATQRAIAAWVGPDGPRRETC